MPWWTCFGLIWNQSKELKRNSDSLILNFISFDNFCIKNIKNTKDKDEREGDKICGDIETMYPSVLKHKGTYLIKNLSIINISLF